MVNQRRSNRSQRSRRNNNVRHFGRTLTRATHGVRITPPVDPPSYTSNPWWPLTVVFHTFGDTEITPDSIYAGILKQMGIHLYVDVKKNTVPLEFRLCSVRCWGIERQPIQLAIYDSLGGKHRFAELTDYGSAVQYSRLGWKYGRVATLDALRSTDKEVSFEISAASKTKVMVYIQVLIRTANAPKPVGLTTFTPVIGMASRS